MLPLPLAGNSTIAHCSRRDEVPVPPLLPALVALLLPPQRCARNIPATMCAASCVPHKAYSVAPSHLRFAPSSIARSAHSVAPSHLQSLFEGWHGVVVRSLDRQGRAAHSSGHSTSASLGRFEWIKIIYIYKPLPEITVILRHTHRIRTNWAIGNGLPPNAHVHPPVLRSHTPGRRPRTPG